MLKFITKLNLFIFPLVGLSACANNPFSSYNSNMRSPVLQVENNQLPEAEKSVVNSNNLLYHLEIATLERMSAKYSDSNSMFSAADKLIDDWIASYKNGTLGTLSNTFTTTMLNDRAVDYVPKDYEKVMVPTYKALNMFALGQDDNARIEITRMYNIEDVIQNYRDLEYAKLSDEEANNQQSLSQFPSYDQFQQQNQNKYDFDTVNSSKVLALKNSYQNAFSHYLAGFIFEALGEPSLSRPGYLKSMQLRPNNLTSQSIKNIDKANNQNNNTTDLLIIQEVGHAPLLKSVSLPIPFNANSGQNNCIHAVTIAFPEIIPDNNSYSNINANIDGTRLNSEVYTDFDLMLARNLHDSLPDLFLHNVLRSAKDVAVQQAACGKGGSLTGLLATVGSIALGSADERTWVFLPKQVMLSRIKLSRGVHNLTVNYNGIKSTIPLNLTNKYQIVSYRVIGSSIYFSPELTMFKN